MKSNRGLLLLVIALITGGLIVFYFSYYGNESEKQRTIREAQEEAEDKIVESPTIQTPHEKLEEVSEEEVVESETMSVEDECQKMQRDLMEFFTYLDKKDYVRKLRIGEDTFSRFKKILHELSLHPPLPAGEGLNYDMIISNIYHSPDILYRYAGFLINSIGGRSYLFRRETRLRLLLNYYCLLTVHEADKKKMNSFGIDITPFLEPLAEEIENYQLLYFRREYAGKLIDLKNYYLRKRESS